MSDDKSKKGPADASKINVHEEYELEHWTKKFGVTREKLKEAVKAAGTGAKAVEDWLKKNP